MKTHENYKKLMNHYKEIHHLSHLSSLASWDQATYMPDGANEARSEAMAYLGVLIHEKSVSDKIMEYIENINIAELSDEEKKVVREIRNNYKKNTCLDSEMVKRKSLLSSKCEHEWREQRKNNDWKGHAKNLKELVKIAREEAHIRSEFTGLDLYSSLIGLYEEGMNVNKIDKIFGDMKTWLPGLINEVCDKQKELNINPLQNKYEVEKQKNLGHEIMAKLGLNFDYARLDISSHPFCGGSPEDVRLTTRYNENDFIDGLMGIIHETGHALYEQNLPRHLTHTPAGNARGMGIHESQSLLHEMQLARSNSFIESIYPLIQKHFGQNLEFDIQNFKNHVRRVQKGYIRVDADEVTYPAHVILRYEIEKDLITKKIEVDDIPEVWDQKMQEYLGLSTKGNYKDGPMQDIHWSFGGFGYFPSYTLGAMYAAQFFNQIRSKNQNLEDEIRSGNYKSVFNWAHDNIWIKGSVSTLSELLIEATGEELNPIHFKNHLENRYLKDL